MKQACAFKPATVGRLLEVNEIRPLATFRRMHDNLSTRPCANTNARLPAPRLTYPASLGLVVRLPGTKQASEVARQVSQVYD